MIRRFRGAGRGARHGALRSRNFRLYFAGLAVSQCGTWMHTIALSFLVLQRTEDNGLAVGAVVACQYLPVALFGSWMGLVADRFDKRRLLQLSQLVASLGAFGLAAVTWLQPESLWPIFALVAVIGSAQAVDMPTRQVFLSEIVRPEELSNAIGITAAVAQLSRIMGPLAGGVLIATIGTSVCFLANALSGLGVMVALLLMNTRELHPSVPVSRGKGQIREGFGYIWRTPVLRSCLGITLVIGLIALNTQVMLPILTRLTFGGTATTYSWLSAAMGLGALCGSVLLAVKRIAVTGRFFIGGCFAFGISMMVAAVAPSVGAFAVLLVVVGCCQIAMLGSGNVVLQLTAEPSMRGRVMAVWAVAVMGTTPLGGPLMGWLSTGVDPRVAYAFAGASSVAAGLAFGGPLLREATAILRISSAAVATPAADNVLHWPDGQGHRIAPGDELEVGSSLHGDPGVERPTRTGGAVEPEPEMVDEMFKPHAEG